MRQSRSTLLYLTLLSAMCIAQTPSGNLRELPHIIHFCAANCMTLELTKKDVYVVTSRNGFEPVSYKSIWTVNVFTPNSLVMNRHDSPNPHIAAWKNGSDVTYTGDISPAGNALIHISANGKPAPGMRMTWGDALNQTPGSNPERDRRKSQTAASAPRSAPREPIRTVSTDGQLKVCTSPDIRKAMQSVEEQAIGDPAGTALQLLGAAVTGVIAGSGKPRIIDSKMGTDGGRSASKDPGSFVCRGLFLRGDVEIGKTSNADAASDITAEAAAKLAEKFPSFIEWFKVTPLAEPGYRLTLLPSAIELSREYSTNFIYTEP